MGSLQGADSQGRHSLELGSWLRQTLTREEDGNNCCNKLICVVTRNGPHGSGSIVNVHTSKEEV